MASGKWIHCILLGQTACIEIVERNGEEVTADQDPPKLAFNDELVIDRGVVFRMTTNSAAGQISVVPADIRQLMGAMFMEEDVTKDSERTKLNLQARAILAGPTVWANPKEEKLEQVIRAVYSGNIQIAGPGDMPPVPPPGALDVMRDRYPK